MQHTGLLRVSVISAGEFFTWALRTKASLQRRQMLLDLLQDAVVLDVNIDVAPKLQQRSFTN